MITLAGNAEEVLNNLNASEETVVDIQEREVEDRVVVVQGVQEVTRVVSSTGQLDNGYRYYNLGRVTPLFKGDYDPDHIYEPHDIVLFEGNLCVALDDIIGVAPTLQDNDKNWAIVLPAISVESLNMEEIVTALINYITEHGLIVGTQGADGAQGSQGIQGIQGIRGTDGRDGVDGAQGIQGIRGTDGQDGQDGQPGAQGADGAQGSQGIQGVQGIRGTDGQDGQPGAQGADGAQGSQGIQGATGETPSGTATVIPTLIPVKVAGGTSTSFTDYTSVYPMFPDIEDFNPQFSPIRPTEGGLSVEHGDTGCIIDIVGRNTYVEMSQGRYTTWLVQLPAGMDLKSSSNILQMYPTSKSNDKWVNVGKFHIYGQDSNTNQRNITVNLWPLQEYGNNGYNHGHCCIKMYNNNAQTYWIKLLQEPREYYNPIRNGWKSITFWWYPKTTNNLGFTPNNNDSTTIRNLVIDNRNLYGIGDLTGKYQNLLDYVNNIYLLTGSCLSILNKIPAGKTVWVHKEDWAYYNTNLTNEGGTLGVFDWCMVSNIGQLVVMGANTSYSE